MKYTLISILFLIISSGLQAQLFKNPLPVRVADAHVSKFGDFYYLVGTPCPGDWNMRWVGVWKSRDMITWSGPYFAFEGEERDTPMWASEIYHKGEQYYIITSCNTWEAGATMLVQKAPTPLGPYTFHAHLKKTALDPGIFVDTDGKSYLLDSEYIAPLSQDWTLVNGPFIGHPENKEGPFLVKNNNEYMRFFARIEEGYPMELEIAKGATPYTDQYHRIGYNGVYMGTNDPGHGCITASPDGTELWVASHFTTHSSWANRWLALGRLFFDSKGLPIPSIRSNEWQSAPGCSISNANMAVGKLANSSAYVSDDSPVKAIDNDLNTAWRVDLTDTNNYLEVDLMGEFEIKKIKLNFGEKAAYRYKIVGSHDRINWELLGEIQHQDLVDCSEQIIGKGYYRFIRVANCFASTLKELNISELQIFHEMDSFVNESLSKRVKLGVLECTKHSPRISVVDCSLGGKNFSGAEKGDKIYFSKCCLPKNGYYDVLFKVATKDYLLNRWTLYENERKITTEAISMTAGNQNWATMISFERYLRSGEHEFRLVVEEGKLEIESVEFVYLEREQGISDVRLPRDNVREQEGYRGLECNNVATHKPVVNALNDSAYLTIDGNILSGWFVQAPIDKDVLVLDLEREVDINSISVLFAYPAAYCFTIYGSRDGENWESVYQQHDSVKRTTTYSGGKGIFRYIKLSELKVNDLPKIGIKEIMVTEK